MNDFSYGQSLLFCKEKIDEISVKNNVNLKIDQDELLVTEQRQI